MRLVPPAAAAVVVTLVAGPAAALSFTKVTTGPVVTDSSRTGGASWEDYDGDGDPDLFVACGNLTPEDNRLYRNDGTGFVLIDGPISSDGTNSIGGTWGDYDGDGDPDLHVVGRSFGGNLLYRNDGGDAFAAITGAGPDSATNDANASSWVDVDLDGDLDLHVINFQQANRQWRNDSGAFTEILTGVQVTQVTSSISGVWQDYDLDGDDDLYVANGLGQNNRLYRNDGGIFVNVTGTAQLRHGGSSIGASWGDWSNDGYPDLFVANQLGEDNYLYRNAGDGTFERILTGAVVTDGGLSTGSSFGDGDNDGDLDLFVGNDGQDNFLYRNDGGGAWTRVTVGVAATDGGATFGVTWADFDSDGFPDLFAANRLGENDFLYRNDGNGNHWLQVRLAGTGGNPAAIGGRVDVFASISAAPVLQTREMASQSGYNSRNDPRLMFGLGDATTVDSLRVTWPSGLVEVHRDVAVDQVLTLTEGETTTGAAPSPARPLALLRATPNPTAGRTTIRWQSPRSEAGALRILDVRGRTVRTLAGVSSVSGSVTWDGRSDSGRPAPAGVYFVALETAHGTAQTRVTLLR
jgi:hypothetical protein